MKKAFLSFILFSTFLLSNQIQRYFDDEIPALNQNRNQNRNSVNISEILSWGEFDEHTYEAMIKIDDQTLAYASFGFYEDGTRYPALIIEDISDPLVPVRISQVELSGYPSWGSFKIKDNHLYVCNSYSGLDIIDITDLSNPLLVGHYDYYYPDDPYASGRLYKIAFLGDTAFVASRQGGLKILDISEPTDPIDMHTYFNNDGSFIDAVEIIDGKVLIGDRSGNVSLLDVTNIYNPSIISQINIGTIVWDIRASDNVLDVLGYTNPIRYAKLNYQNSSLILVNDVIDISDGYTFGMERSGDFIYIPEVNKFTRIHSPLNNNDDLSIDSSVDLFSINPYCIISLNEKIYLSSYSGYVFYDLSANQYIGGNFDYDGSAGDIYANDSLVIINDNIANVLKLFSYNENYELILRSEIQDEWVYFRDGIYVQNDDLLLISGSRIIWYDISNIADPVFVDDYYADNDEFATNYLKIAFTSEFFVAGKLVYDQGTYGNFDVLKLSDNGEIEFLNYLFLGGTYDDFYYGDLSLIGDPISDKIFILNQKSGDQTELREITSNAILEPIFTEPNISPSTYGEYAHDLDQGELYILSNSDYIYRIDLSNPSDYITIPLLSELNMVGGSGSRIDIEYPYCYFYDNQPGDSGDRNFYVFDLSNDNEWIGFHENINDYFRVDSKIIFNYLGNAGLKAYKFDENPLPYVDFNSDSLNFISTNDNTDSRSVFIKNSGSVNLEISSVAQNNSAFTLNNYIPLTVNPGDSVELIINFNPVDLDYGEQNSIMFLENNSVNVPTIEIELNGFVDIYEEPAIISISDIPNDQGGQVRVTFKSSKWDIVDYESFEFANDPGEFYDGINSYSIWRKLDDSDWDAVGSFDAINDSIYHFVSPTLCDSTISNGECWSTFRVSAHHSSSDYWISDADSGYSVDNIAPAVPTNFIASYYEGGLNLSWDAVQDYDFQYYIVDKSADSLFETDQHPSYQLLENSFLDNDFENTDIVYYRVSAIDYSGNKSSFSSVISSATLSNENYYLPQIFALHQNYPNPFNPTTSINYDLPKNEFISINVFDLMGREVKTLVNKEQEAGFRSVKWDATNNLGQPVSAGMYIYTIQAGEFRQTRKMVLLK